MSTELCFRKQSFLAEESGAVGTTNGIGVPLGAPGKFSLKASSLH